VGIAVLLGGSIVASFKALTRYDDHPSTIRILIIQMMTMMTILKTILKTKMTTTGDGWRVTIIEAHCSSTVI
jgi:hypothetical protein